MAMVYAKTLRIMIMVYAESQQHYGLRASVFWMTCIYSLARCCTLGCYLVRA